MADENNTQNLDALFDDEIVIKDADGKKRTVLSSQLSDIVKDEIKKKKQVKSASMQQLHAQMKEVMQRVMQASGIDFQGDQIMEVRFKNIILARLKKIRDKNATQDALTRERTKGGLALREDVAQKVVNAIEKEFKALSSAENEMKGKEVQRPTEDQIKVAPSKPLAPPPPTKKKAKQATPAPLEIPKVPKQAPAPKPVQAPGPQQVAPSAKPTQVKTPKVPQAPAKKEKEPLQISRPQVIDSGRPRLQDVKHPSRLMGPIDELQALSLTDFRRLSSNTKEATEKIFAKFDLLEDEHYEKRMQGILAYFSSPLFGLYIQTGLKSLEEQKTVDQIIGVREKEETLTKDEFMVLNEFHQSIL